MFSEFFIRRPIFASVISIVIVLAGLASIKALPIAQYPNIIPPVVQVTAVYPGASAQVAADTVAAPLEQQINGVDNMIYMQSGSDSNGNMTLNVTFKIGTDPDQATINVNNKVQSALSGLPEEVRRQGVIVQKQSTSILQVVALYSPDNRFNTLYMSNYALLNVIDELKRLPGVGQVTNFASQDYSMRIWLSPDKLAQLKLTPSDVSDAISAQNSQYAAGQVGAEPQKKKTDFTYTVTTQGRLTDISEFENIIVRSNPDGSSVRLKDVARVELGSLNYNFSGKFNGKPTIPLGIYLSPGANQLATAEAVDATMAQLSKKFPEGLAYAIPYDTTKFVQVSIDEVYKTLGEAMVLVFLVVFLFLQNWRATLIPCLAVPVSIIGTFAGMYLFGFSINTLTLFGMVLAIGIVVDDAIVVLENVERIMTTEKLPPTEATIKAMSEVSGPVVAIVLVLCSVFIPVAFLGGIAGQMYKQFAITIAVSVAISGTVALTLTPALCAVMLKPEHMHQKKHRFFNAFNNFFDNITNKYVGGVALVTKHLFRALVVYGVLILAIFGLFRILPGSLAPNEDQGYVITATYLPDGASLSRTSAAMEQFDQIARKNPAIQDLLSFSGMDILSNVNKTNAGVSFVVLKPWGERTAADESSFAVAADLQKRAMAIRDGVALTFNPPPITGMSTTGGFEAYLQTRSGASPQELEAAVRKIIAEAAKDPVLAGVQSTYSADVPQIYVQLDRDKSMSLGVPINQVFDTMASTFGSLYVNDFNKFGRIFKVELQSESDFRSSISDLSNIFVRSQTTGDMIPLSSLVTVKNVTGPQMVERFNIFPAAKIVGGPAPGRSSGEAIKAMEEITAKVLPGSDFTLAWTGSAFQEVSTGGSSSAAFIFGLIMVFLILAAQYERWTLPLAVLMAVPFAVFGALAFTLARGLENDVYFQVALITLIGLAAKNAILIVEFAIMQMEAGEPLYKAALDAAKLRFRPIVMTSLAFVLGCVPLAISSGAGANSRHAIGTGIIGGMLGATFIAIFFIPLFFLMIMRWSQKKPKDGEPLPAPPNVDRQDASQVTEVQSHGDTQTTAGAQNKPDEPSKEDKHE